MRYSNKSISLLLVALITTLISTFTFAQLPDNTIIIGLTQKHNAEKKAIAAILAQKLSEVDLKYNQQLLEREIQYYKDATGLSNKNRDKQLQLVKDTGKSPEYIEKKKELDSEYSANLKSLLDTFKENNRKINLFKKQAKVHVTQEHRPKKNDLGSQQRIELNQLKENHESNKSKVSLLQKSDKNSLNAIIHKETKSLNSDQLSAQEEMRHKHKQQLLTITSKEEKQFVKNKVQPIEYNNLYSRNNDADRIMERGYNLLKHELYAKHKVINSALSRVHDIEINGGTIDEYAAMKNILNEFDVIYSIYLGANDSASNTSTPSPTDTVFEQPAITSNIAYQQLINPFLRGQCTWYVYGRVMEQQNKTLVFTQDYDRHAQNWPRLLDSNHVDKISEPRAGAIAVWTIQSGETPDQGLGHVAYIEKVEGNTIFFTEANNSVSEQYDGDIEQLDRSIFENGRAGGSGNLWENFLGYYLPK